MIPDAGENSTAGSKPKTPWKCRTDKHFSDINDIKPDDKDNILKNRTVTHNNAPKELTISLFNGKQSKWSPLKSQDLTYAIDTKSLPHGPVESPPNLFGDELKSLGNFDAFTITQDAMKKATDLWESVCSVNFKEVGESENPLFLVRYLAYTGLPENNPDFAPGQGGVVAEAFFSF